MMKSKLLVGSLLFAGLSSHLYAEGQCNQIQAKYERPHNGLYQFSSSANCSFSSSLSSTEIKEKLLSALGVEEDSGSFEYVDSYSSVHGNISITFDANTETSESSLKFNAESTNIEADGDADNTKKVLLEVTYTLSKNKVLVKIHKTVDIHKPFLAPWLAFEPGVVNGLKEEMGVLESTFTDFL